jgi:adenosine deaminase
MTLTEEVLHKLPKIELHVHLDTSVRPQTVGELAAQQGIPVPDDLNGALIAPPICTNLKDYLTRVDLALEVLQTTAALERVAYELVGDTLRPAIVHPPRPVHAAGH